VAVSRLLRLARVLVLAMAVGCGLDVSGREVPPDVPLVSATSMADAGQEGPGEQASPLDAGRPPPPGASTTDATTPSDAAAPADAAADDASPIDAAAMPDAPAKDPVDPCKALAPCCKEVDALSSSSGCDAALAADNPTACSNVLGALEGAGLCH
jgi:hypothetical protein